MNLLDGLNEQQLAAVLHEDGPQLVIAGAGTGKTQVITRRIAQLIATGRAKPAQILALTFTEKAAREMEERLYELIGWESFQVPVLTFNAFGSELLARYASHIGRSIRGGLLNETQKTLLLQQHFDRITLLYYGPQDDIYEFLEGVVGYIGQLQNAGVGPQAYAEYVARLKSDPEGLHPSEIDEQTDLSRIYTLYEELKVEAGAFDYSDQLNLPLEILRSRPNLAERLGQEFRYVLVDEYQDTNIVQDSLLRTFVGTDGNIFAVGDDDQAIYGFRGAQIDNILDFAEHYNLPKPAVLVQNYRSGQAVLDAAYQLIQHNNPYRLEQKLALDKRLLAQHDQSTVQLVQYSTARDEISGVVAHINRRVAAGESTGGIAVLAATHAPLKTLAKALLGEGLPYAISTSVSIFDQPELISLWYLLKWLQLDASDDEIAHILLGPFAGWTSESLRGLLSRSRDELITLEESLRRSEDEQAVTFVGQLELWRSWARGLTVGQLVFKLIFDTGIADRWQKQAETSARMVRVFEDLHRLLEHMQDYATVALSPDLAGYLNSFPRPPVLEVAEPIGDDTGVQLLTVHAAKGLEFNTVYLIACTQRSWSAGRGTGRKVPAALSLVKDLPTDHEFRRLMYVAVTRAKSELIVSAPILTAAGSRQMISPFVGEIFGDDLVSRSLPDMPAGSPENHNMMRKLQRFYPLGEHIDGHRLPFERDDGWLDLSVTALGSYDFCPFEFYLQHVLKISQPMGPQLAFGSALHRVFEKYFKSTLAGDCLSLEELSLFLDESWSDRGYADRSGADADLALAHRTLQGFYARETAVSRGIIGSEVPIRFDLPEAKLRLRGKIDALFEHGTGYEIRDFKTGRTKTDPEKLAKLAKTNFQLRSYAVACEQLRGDAPVAVVLDYVVTQVEGEATLSGTILSNHRDKLAVLADRIRQRDFAPNTSSLHQCAAIRFYGSGEQDDLSEQAIDSSNGAAQ